MVDSRLSAAWRKSSRCDSGSCVEVALVGEEIAVRDGKNPTGHTLQFTRMQWKAFTEGIRAGEFEIS